MWCTFFETNTRDKMLIIAIVWLATLDLFLVAYLCYHGKITEALAIFALASSLGGTLAGAYKGNTTPPIPTSSQTDTTVKTTEKVGEKGEKDAS